MIALVLAAALLAEATPVQPVVFTNPPAIDARQEASSGPMAYAVAVTLECTAYADGRVGACTVLGETDPGLGFGEAAIAMMQDAEVAPGPRDVQFARTIQFAP